MYILKYYQLPGLFHEHVDLDVHLDPQDGLENLRNHKIRILLEKLDFYHMFCPGITRIEDKLFLVDYHGVPAP